MNCPKCAGGAFLGDEDLVKVMESTQPMKLLIKQTFMCRACSERFSRIVWDDMDARRREDMPPGTAGTMPVTEGVSSTPDQTAAGIQFLDKM